MNIRQTLMLTIVLVLLTASVIAQSERTWTPAERNLNVEMLFPGGKSKALILSYDDGSIQDRKLVSLLNKYRLKGTFHLNAGKLNSDGIVSKEEVKTLYKGHEVSAHGFNHLGLKNLTTLDLFYELSEDRRVLEEFSPSLVRGLAYPFGAYNTKHLKSISSMGIEYARTVDDTYAFGIPEEPLLWHPTVHKFAKMNYGGQTKEQNEKEYDKFKKLTEKFLDTKELALYSVWGHSWEYTNEWNKVEEFFKIVSGKEDVAYLKSIELFDYLKAFKSLRVSADKKKFLNKSGMEVFIRVTDYKNPASPSSRVLKIKPGYSIELANFKTAY